MFCVTFRVLHSFNFELVVKAGFFYENFMKYLTHIMFIVCCDDEVKCVLGHSVSIE